MGTAMFYHLTRSTPEDVLAFILPKALAAGWRVMLRSPDPARIDLLDARLWTDPDDGFLPHGVQGGDWDSEQPVLLGAGSALNGAQGVALLDGAQPLAGEERLQRLWVLFDGHDAQVVQAARRLWSELTARGMTAQYWSEEGGRWAMKAEKKSDAPDTPDLAK